MTDNFYIHRPYLLREEFLLLNTGATQLLELSAVQMIVTFIGRPAFAIYTFTRL